MQLTPFSERLYRLVFMTMPSVVIACLLVFAPDSARAQTQDLATAIRQPWTVYVFVSSTMPRASLVSLARDAGRVHATLVFRGFPSGDATLQGQQRLVAELNESCCGLRLDLGEVSRSRVLGDASRVGTPGWEVDPVLFERFGVRAVPCVVLSESGATATPSFVKVSGDMSLGTAFKFMAQKSSDPERRAAATAIYGAAFGGQP